MAMHVHTFTDICAACVERKKARLRIDMRIPMCTDLCIPCMRACVHACALASERLHQSYAFGCSNMKCYYQELKYAT